MSSWSNVKGRRYQTDISPLEKFNSRLYNITTTFNDNHYIIITQDELNMMKNKAEEYKKIEFLNPVAYVLGFFVTNGGDNIDERKLIQVYQQLDHFGSDDKITKPDVIRYARLWQTFYKV